MRLLKYVLPLILLASAVPCFAQTTIHRCVDASGHALFTDQTCAAMQATAVQPAAKPAASPLMSLNTDVKGTPTLAPIEPPPILCAATFDKLRQSVIDAFANRNANRMAGLMLWNGYGSEAAVANIRSLATLMQQPLLDAGPPSAANGPADESQDTAPADQDDEAAADGSELVLHLAGTDGNGNPRELHYGVVHRYGCLWLRVGG